MRVVWSHKIQEKQADILAQYYKIMEIIRIISISITSVGLISLFFTDEIIVKLLSTFLSFLSFSISLFFRSFDLQKSISNHKKTAVELLIIREKLEILLMRVRIGEACFEDLLLEYKEILKQLHEIYKNAPNTTNKAVEKAKKALQVSKDNNFTDEEINANLPELLRMD